MKIETLSALEGAIKAAGLFRKYNLDRIGVFGSFARGETANDLDFYVDSDDCRLEEMIELKKDLEKIADKKVDIMLKRYANPIILFRAERDMKYVAR